MLLIFFKKRLISLFLFFFIYFFIFFKRYISLFLLFYYYLEILCYFLFKFWYKYTEKKIKNNYEWILNHAT